MAREKELDPGELGPPWTVLKLLRWTAGYFEDQGVTDTPRLDADLLLGEVLDLERVELYARTDTEVPAEPRGAFRELVKRRAAGEPVAYLVGRRSFWQMELYVDDRVLIPRPETEVLVEETLAVLPEEESVGVVDVGTGSGAVVLALARERPSWSFAATDESEEALEVAARNARRHDLDEQIDWFQGDLLEALPEDWGPVDAVVSNPPYVPEPRRDDVQIEVRDHEPDDALFAGPGGLEIVSRLIPAARERLVDGGWLLLEIGHNQSERVADLLEEAGYRNVEIRQDYADHDRVVRGEA